MKIADEKTTMKTKLLEALSDDLNVSQGLSIIDEMVANTNETLDATPKDKLIKRQTTSDLAFIEKILGFGHQNPFEYFQFGLDAETKTKIDDLVEQRSEAKKEKDFEKSDAIRDEIMSFGVSIMDTAQGTFWERTE